MEQINNTQEWQESGIKSELERGTRVFIDLSVDNGAFEPKHLSCKCRNR